MFHYILRRLFLLPVTLFCIALVNFVIINLAPGDPATVTEVSPEGEASRKQDRSQVFGSDERYLQFREFYGLTLPILFNTWVYASENDVEHALWQIVHHRFTPQDAEEMSVKDYNDLKRDFGDESRFIMPHLLDLMQQADQPIDMRATAIRFFVRGGTRQAILGPGLADSQKAYNKKIARENQWLTVQFQRINAHPQELSQVVQELQQWYQENQEFYQFEPNWKQKISLFFFETRFFRYLSRIAHLDFGTLRNDNNRTVMGEVISRFKYSLTLAVVPMLITFVLCQIVGFTMAYKRNQWPDFTLNVMCLILYAIPVFVVAPFLIEKLALNHNFPFTNIPIPISGFTSSDAIYLKETAWERLWDVLQHIALPIVAITYGSLAAQSRLSRTAILEVLNQDYIRTAWAKGLPPFTIFWKHVGRNAAITIVTSIAGSLGVLLGGSLIVETLFDINGFGKFFYDSVVNRDYNAIMFSTLAGSFLTLLGYLVADIAYTCLDPRITLE